MRESDTEEFEGGIGLKILLSESEKGEVLEVGFRLNFLLEWLKVSMNLSFLHQLKT